MEITDRIGDSKCVKVFLMILTMVFGPLNTIGFYHYDIISDILQIVSLFRNCHKYYASLSIFFLVLSYFTTALHLICNGETWLDAIAYPHRHVYESYTITWSPFYAY